MIPCLQASADAKRPLLLELGRYLTPGTDTLTDPAYEAYHGIAEAPVGKQLAEPGRTSVSFSAAVKLGCQEAVQEGLLPQAGLPAPEPSTNAKASLWCGMNAAHAQVPACRVWRGAAELTAPASCQAANPLGKA